MSKRRRKSRGQPKGRQVDGGARAEVLGVLEGAGLVGEGGEMPARDLLIEGLHAVQDAFGFLSAAHLAGLADLMRLAMSEVYEVATFYAHFEVVKEGERVPPAPGRTIRVCDSIACQLAGAEGLIGELEAARKGGEGGEGGEVRVVRAPCMGRCEVAPVAEVGHFHCVKAGAGDVLRAVAEGRTRPEIPKFVDFAGYRKGGGMGCWGSVCAGSGGRRI